MLAVNINANTFTFVSVICTKGTLVQFEAAFNVCNSVKCKVSQKLSQLFLSHILSYTMFLHMLVFRESDRHIPLTSFPLKAVWTALYTQRTRWNGGRCVSGTRLVKTPGDQNVSALGEQTGSVLMQVLLSILHERVIVRGKEEETETGGGLRRRLESMKNEAIQKEMTEKPVIFRLLRRQECRLFDWKVSAGLRF